MGGKEREACGRCSISTVLEVAGAGGDAEGDGGAERPFDGDRIELEADEVRPVVRHEVVARRVKERLDGLAARLMFD